MDKRKIKNIIYKFRWFFVVMILIIAIIFFLNLFNFNNKILSVSFLDVGQGDAIFINTPNGKQVLIDGGVSGPVLLRKLSEVMPFWDRSIDIVIATHPDKDHIGGLGEVMRRFNVKYVATSGVVSNMDVFRSFQNASKQNGALQIILRSGDFIVLDNKLNIKLDILNPSENTIVLDTNDTSIVAKLIYGSTSFLFTGDISIKAEKYLLFKNGEDLDVDVLKVGHHGSASSSSKEFIEKISPEIAILSVGCKNPYGHPSQKAVDRLREVVNQIISTCEKGTIVINTNGSSVYVK